jgi:hypothetical protein
MLGLSELGEIMIRGKTYRAETRLFFFAGAGVLSRQRPITAPI